MTVVRVRVRVRGLVASAGSRRAVGWQRSWTEGKVLVLDDAFEHEVWNDSDEKRMILIVDVWHPDFSDAEVAWMAATRAARHERSGGGGAVAKARD